MNAVKVPLFSIAFSGQLQLCNLVHTKSEYNVNIFKHVNALQTGKNINYNRGYTCLTKTPAQEQYSDHLSQSHKLSAGQMV